MLLTKKRLLTEALPQPGRTAIFSAQFWQPILVFGLTDHLSALRIFATFPVRRLVLQSREYFVPLISNSTGLTQHQIPRLRQCSTLYAIMKRFTILIIGIIAACNGNKPLQSQNIIPNNSKLVTTTLSDSLGTVTLYVPNSYDTFFKWINRSDCGKPCNYDEYRFQSKSLPIEMESGWLWLGELKDSIERFTIVHSSYFPFHEIKDSIPEIIKLMCAHRKHNLSREEHVPKVTTDFIEKINGRYFYIITIDRFDSTNAQYSKKLFGGTLVKGNEIEFRYELLTKNKDSITQNFIENSMQFLKTVKLSNGI